MIRRLFMVFHKLDEIGNNTNMALEVLLREKKRNPVTKWYLLVRLNL